jgi:hypothetical protein
VVGSSEPPASSAKPGVFSSSGADDRAEVMPPEIPSDAVAEDGSKPLVTLTG